jgi:hypothetical protein
MQTEYSMTELDQYQEDTQWIEIINQVYDNGFETYLQAIDEDNY